VNQNPRLYKKINSDSEGVYYSFIKGWLNHYEKIANNSQDLYQKIDKIILEKYFNKKRTRKSFYNSNQ